MARLFTRGDRRREAALGGRRLALFERLQAGPRFRQYTDEQFEPLLTPAGQTNKNVLGVLYGGAPAATYNLAETAPHVQTSPGVYESAFRLAGRADPRQAKWDAMVGRQSSAGIDAATVNSLLASPSLGAAISGLASPSSSGY